MILAIGLTRRLVTTVFFADDPDSVRDPVLDCVKDAAAREGCSPSARTIGSIVSI